MDFRGYLVVLSLALSVFGIGCSAAPRSQEAKFDARGFAGEVQRDGERLCTAVLVESHVALANRDCVEKIAGHHATVAFGHKVARVVNVRVIDSDENDTIALEISDASDQTLPPLAADNDSDSRAKTLSP